MHRGLIALLAAIAAVAVPNGATAEAAYDPCPSDPALHWMGESKAHAVSIPSLTHPFGITSYRGSILKPADRKAYPGARPLVVLQHGLGGNQCGLVWAARMLAGHGYVAMIWTSPNESTPGGAFVNAVDATRSALAFARSPSNPYAKLTDTKRIAIAGHSMGSIDASYVQQDHDRGVRAIVALDNLRRYVSGDPGAALFECANPPSNEITPRVPALGFAMDEPCAAKPDYAPPDLKEIGFKHWRKAGVPSMELVMRGFQHSSFTGKGSDQQHRYVAHYFLAWMRLWLDGHENATKRLLATRVDGVATPSILSSRFLSGAFLPPEVHTNDFATWLGARQGDASQDSRRWGR